MLENAVENQKVKFALLIGKFKTQNFLYVILAVLVLLILSLILVNLFLSKQKSNVSKNRNTNSISTKTNQNSEIAKNTLVWLNKQKDERGFYHKSVGCSTDNGIKCNIPVEAGKSGHDGLVAIWARYKYYQKYNNSSDSQIIVNDIDNYEKQLNEMEIQNDFWNCKFMYDLWNSKDFSEDVKKKIERICWTSTYMNTSEIDSSTLRRATDDYLFRSETNLKTEVPKIDLKNPGNLSGQPEDQMIKAHIPAFASYGSDFAIRYVWKNNEKDKQIAEAYFNKSVKLYFQEPQLYKGDALCILGISSLDLAQISKDKNYIDFAVDIYNKNNLGDAKNGLVYQTPVCGLFNNELAKIVGDKKYQSRVEEIKKYIINTFLDKSDVAFYEIDPGNGSVLNKKIRQNGLMVGLLISQ